MFKFNSAASIGDSEFDDAAQADRAGPGAPRVDVTNTGIHMRISDPGCNGGPLFEIDPNKSYGFLLTGIWAKACALGIDPVWATKASYVWNNDQNTQVVKGNTPEFLVGTSKLGAGQILNPTVAPTVSVTSSGCGGYPGNGVPSVYT